MYFVYRDGKYIDASGQSFRDFMAGRLPALPGETPISIDELQSAHEGWLPSFMS
jgi:glutamate--cysteine ligase